MPVCSDDYLQIVWSPLLSHCHRTHVTYSEGLQLEWKPGICGKACSSVATKAIYKQIFTVKPVYSGHPAKLSLL